MAENATGNPYKGLDVGTSRIVLARLDGDRPTFSSQLNAFVAMPYAKMTEAMLDREKILHEVEGSQILAYGNRCDEFANLHGGDSRRPMQTGVLNPTEPKSIQMVALSIEKMCGRAKPGDKICFSVPSVPPDNDAGLIFHEHTITQILEDLGYEVSSVNEGLAVVYAEMKSDNFTGIGISFGGGMCNVCLSYLALPVLRFGTERAGDFIDTSAAKVSGETPTTIRLHKEKEFKLSAGSRAMMDHALSVYYTDIIKGVVKGIEEAFANTRSLPPINNAIPVVVSGGTAKVQGFGAALKKALGKADIPVEISDIRLARDSMNVTAKGALVAAMLNM